MAAAKNQTASNSMKIAVIPGDGIGNEVVPEGIRVLEAVGARFGLDYAWDHLDWSCQRFAKTGAMMPADGLAQIAKHDAIYPGRRRLARRARPRVAVGPADPDPARLPAVRQPAPRAAVRRA